MSARLCCSAAALPRRLAHALASTSGIKHAPSVTRRGSLAGRARITNTKQELYDAEHPDPTTDEFMEIDAFPVWDPQKGDLSTRISRTFLEELRSDQISLEETAYWFSAPPGGWNSVRRLRKAVEAPEPAFPEPYHAPEDAQYDSTNEEGEVLQRLRLDELEEGEVLAGIVTDIWLYHGAQVDVLCEWDGLIPIQQPEWADIENQLLPGTEVLVRVHRVRQPGLYRWPLQLEIVEPAGVAAKIIPPDEWECPADLGWAFEQGWTIEEAAEALGRRYVNSRFYLERDHSSDAFELQKAYGWDEDDIEGLEDDVVERTLDAATEEDIEDVVTRRGR